MQELKAKLFFLCIIGLFIAINYACEASKIPGCATDMECRAPRICVKGECVNPDEQKDGGADHICQNECNTIGQKQCFGDGWKECRDYNQNGCLEYGPFQKCSPGEYCEKDKCQPVQNRQGKIAFMSEVIKDGQPEDEASASVLYIINEDGNELKNLSAIHAFHNSGYNWSPDGEKIAYNRRKFVQDGEDTKSVEDIYVVNVKDGTSINLTEPLGLFIYSPSHRWSPDGTKIAFDGFDIKMEHQDIFTIDFDGNLLNLTEKISLSGEGGENRRPVWSPDGTRIAFECEINDNREICVLNVSKGEIKNLTKISDSNGRPIWPLWSPNGEKIIFLSAKFVEDSTKDFKLYIMNANGSDQKKLVDGVGHCAWSPDGQIAFVDFSEQQEGDGYLEGIFVMDIYGKVIKKIVEIDDIGYFSYSPDGSKIVFDANYPPDAQLTNSDEYLGHLIYIINSDGSGLRQLTDFQSYGPKWTP